MERGLSKGAGVGWEGTMLPVPKTRSHLCIWQATSWSSKDHPIEHTSRTVQTA